MTDYFAVVGLPRRPGVDENVLQENYLKRAASWHPDAPGGDVEKFRELQDARKILSDPAARLRHLLALEGYESQAGSSQAAPELFLEVAGVLEMSKSVRRRLENTRSAIGRAALVPERQRAEQRILQISGEVAARREELLNLLAREDRNWPDADFSTLEKIGKTLVFLTRWSSELRDSLFQLQSTASP